MKPLRLLTIALSLSPLMCGQPLLSGGSTDTGNARVAAVMYAASGSPAVNASVLIRPEYYLKSIDSTARSDSRRERETLTDGSGRFSFDSIPAGSYRIEINDGISAAAVFNFVIDSGNVAVVSLSDTLRPYAVLSGSIGMETGPLANAFVQVFGIERCVAADEAGLFMFTDLPPGVYRFNIVSDEPSFIPVITDSITLVSDSTLSLPFAAWPKSRRIILNTSASGAAVTESVYGFPVLVRLTTSNFKFSEAGGGGDGFRLVKSNGRLLPYEIERWDPANGSAEIWARVDTVAGNNSSQYFTMYWGNPNTAADTLSSAVFDTAEGFRGVWHLNEETGDVKDATANGFNGSRNGRQNRTFGTIGYGQICRDSGDYSDMGNVLNPETSNITVSAWIKRSVTGGTNTVIGKTNGDTIVGPGYGWLMAVNQDYLRFYLASGGTFWGDAGTFWCESSSRILDTTAWHHVAAVINRSGNINCRLYIDGVDVSSIRRGNIIQVSSLTNTLAMRIAIEADMEYPLRGNVDEATVSFVTRSSAWIRLCYMNQRGDDKLVQFK